MMTQTVTASPQPRETDRTNRERLAQRLAAAAILGLTVTGCAGAGAQQTSRDGTPHWHEEHGRDPDAGVGETLQPDGGGLSS